MNSSFILHILRQILMIFDLNIFYGQFTKKVFYLFQNASCWASLRLKISTDESWMIHKMAFKIKKKI